jgi:hypothetical protein
MGCVVDWRLQGSSRVICHIRTASPPAVEPTLLNNGPSLACCTLGLPDALADSLELWVPVLVSPGKFQPLANPQNAAHRPSTPEHTCERSRRPATASRHRFAPLIGRH